MKNTAVDDIFLALGSWGRYEKLQFVMLMLPVLPTALHIVSIVFIALHIVSIVFIGRTAEHQCAPFPDSQHRYYREDKDILNFTTESILASAVEQNSSIGKVYYSRLPERNFSHRFVNGSTTTYDKCSVEIRDRAGHLLSSTACPHGYEYEQPRDRTIVSEWDLVCESDAFSDLSQTIMGVGMGIGAFGFPALSDKYGRKIAFILADLTMLASGVSTAFAPNFAIFTCFRFLTGMVQQGASIVSYVLLLEQLPTTHRTVIIQTGMFVWPLSLLSMSLIAYLTREVSWRYTQLLLSACSFYALFQFWCIDESVRWLLANKRFDQAERVIRRAARISGVSAHKVMQVFKDKIQSPLVPMTPSAGSENPRQQLEGGDDIGNERVTQDTAPSGPVKENFLVALKDKHMFKITAISFYMWFADCVTYYGLILTSGSLVNDLYLGYAVNILVELPAGVAFFFATSRYSRRSCMIFFHLMAGLALLAVVALTTIQAAQSIPGVNIMVIVISLIGKFGSATGYGVLWMYTPELFPTNIRTTGFGLSSLAARIGVMITPFSRTLGRHLPWAPGVIFSILCLLIPVLTLFLPEMHGQELPQTIADMKKLKKVNSERKEKKSGS
ncbi:hypothetical protein RRG08_028367 [Elysia crispata]|uniref:Major facilitator superfamily (MFS) profile domain-containing protein n=1 Tax=Elysia crispata TaxID=231223 RepID=A0AAE1AWG1_9GAST|nr:hypothetical protein RRG08_028367 [Elysia crispata]